VGRECGLIAFVVKQRQKVVRAICFTCKFGRHDTEGRRQEKHERRRNVGYKIFNVIISLEHESELLFVCYNGTVAAPQQPQERLAV